MLYSQFSLLLKERFLPLFICQFFGAFNDNLFKNAVVILITYKLSSAAPVNPEILVSIAAGIFILPFFLFSALAGQLADRYDKAFIARWIKLAEILIMLIAIPGFYLNNTIILLVVLFCMGAHSTFFGPIKYSILPQYLKREELIAGNALVSAGTFVAILLGTIGGGLLINIEPLGVEIVSVCIVSAAVVGYVASLFMPRTESLNPNLKINLNIFSSTAELLGYAKNNRTLMLTLYAISWFWLLGATFLSQFPNYVKNVIHGDETVVTLLLTVFTIGIGIGALLCNRVLKGEVTTKLVPIAALALGLFTIYFYFISESLTGNETLELINALDFISKPYGANILVALLLIAMSGGFYVVPLYATMQAESTESSRARVIAGNNVMNALFMVASALGCSLLFFLNFSVNDIFLLAAIGNFLVAIYVLQLLPYKTLKSLLQGVFRWLYDIEIKGIENFHKAGNKIVIIPNHISFLDAPLLTIFLPDKVTFAINTYIAELWWVKPTLPLVKTFAMDPTNPMAMKYLIDEVKNDSKLVIFPEGRITVTGSMMKIYEGPGMIADRADATVLPIRIDGAQYTIFSRIKKKVRVRAFPKITITIMPPVTIHAPKEIKGRARRKLIGQKLYDVMSNMMYESVDREKTLFSSLIEASHINGINHHIAMDIDRKPISYRRLLAGSFILGRRIARKTEKDEYVGIMLPNSIACVTTFFAVQAYGRIPAMINFSTGVSNVIHAIKIANIKKIYTSRKFIEHAKFNDVIEKISQVAHVVYLEDMREKIKSLERFVGLFKAYYAYVFYNKYNPDVTPESPAVTLFTSGSEGVPKGVVLSHKNIQTNRAQLAARIDFGPTDIVFNALPVFHSFGLTAGTILPLISGIRTFFYPTPLHYRIIPELVYDINATVMFGTDTFLAGYAKFAHTYDFYSIRYVFAGAEKLKPETRKLWSEKFGIRILEGYGATETSPVISANTPMHNKDGTVGRILPGIEYYLKPVEGIEGGGRLVVGGENVMMGYLNASNPGKITPAGTERGEKWYDTGDIVAVDEQGYVTIKGRAKRFAKIAGEMVSLTFVEDYISRKWIKGQHAIVAIPDLKRGEQLILVTDIKDLTREMISSLAKEIGVSELFVPRKVINVRNVPTLATGKVDYMSVQKIVEEAKE